MASDLLFGCVVGSLIMCVASAFAMYGHLVDRRLVIESKALLLGAQLEELDGDAGEFGCRYRIRMDDGSVIMGNSKTGLLSAYIVSKGIKP
jgi:hypothetical protein